MDLLDVKWDYKKGTIRQNRNVRPEDMMMTGNTFYTCAYVCPYCGKNMFKANTNGNITIKTPYGNQKILSVFACFDCKKMFSATKTGGSLGDGEYMTLTNSENVLNTFLIVEAVGLRV